MHNNLHLQGKVSHLLIVLHVEEEIIYAKSLELYIFGSWFQVEDPAMRWQMSLYKEMAGKAEDAEDPEKVVKRVQEVSAVLYHIEVVSINTNSRVLQANKHDYVQGVAIIWLQLQLLLIFSERI